MDFRGDHSTDSLLSRKSKPLELVDQLRGTLGRLELALGLAADAIVLADPEGAIQWCSAAFDELIGKPHIEILGHKLIHCLPLEQGGQAVATEQHPVTSILGAQEAVNGEYRFGSKALEIVARREHLPHGAGRAVFVIRDVTERVRAEDEMRRLNARLEATNRELETFSYSVSHDLRAPLRSIDGFSHALLTDFAGELPPKARDFLERVRSAAQRMAQLIDDLLQLSRLTRAQVQWASVNLSNLALEVARDLKRAGPDRRVDLSIQEGVIVDGDDRLLRVALENLIGNAWKFTSRARDPRIEFGAAAKGPETAYFVRDNGAGFDMEYATKLFMPFERLHKPADYPGTGIGLATVQRVVQHHGGRVWAESAPGRGATFYFTLGPKGAPP